MSTDRIQPTLGRAALAQLLPHAGDMVLLDAVESWDAYSIRCRTWSHLRCNNPLRRGPVVGAAAAIEYGAQAMAVHGALLTGAVAPAGMVAAAGQIGLRVARLDGVFSELNVGAQLLAQDSNGARYSFDVAAASGVLASGRITVVFTRPR